MDSGIPHRTLYTCTSSVPSGDSDSSEERWVSVTTWERRPSRLTVVALPQLRCGVMALETGSPVQCHLTVMTSLATPVDDLGVVRGLPVCANVPLAVEVTVPSGQCALESISVADIGGCQQTDDRH